MASPIPSVALASYPRYSEEEMRLRAEALYETLNMRRTVRDFSDAPVPREVIESCIKTASTAPSGANQQPWHFAVVGDAVASPILCSCKRDELRRWWPMSPGRRGGERSLTCRCHCS